jgi:hypothetical protein
MATRLYLDTARLGRMCPEAQAADIDFARFASEEGCSLYFEQFLRSGYMALPPSLARQYLSLSFWAGISAFKNDLRSVLALPAARKVFVANRSAQLVRLAARALCRRCDNILISDLEWPAYLQILSAECRRHQRTITAVPVRHAVFREKISKAALTDRLASCYRNQNCDGLFLSAVTFQGIRLPVAELIAELNDKEKPRFTVVDGAQALNHIPLGLANGYCDLFLAGCHKWLRAYHPMGLACCCRSSSEPFIESLSHDMFAEGDLDDPLFDFTSQLEQERPKSFSETVNLAPLFTAAAAVRRMATAERPKCMEHLCQLENAQRAVEHAVGTGWKPATPVESLQTGILLLESAADAPQAVPVDALRQRFLSQGIALTAYENGLVRTSFPVQPLGSAETALFRSALSFCI